MSRWVIGLLALAILLCAIGLVTWTVLYATSYQCAQMGGC